METKIKWDLKGLSKIKGEKITLRYPKPSDAKIISKMISKPEIVGNIGLNKKRTVSYKEEKKWIEKHPKQRTKNKEIHWVIEDNTTKDIVGVCGFKDTTQSQYRFGSTGMWIAKEYWGKGYSKEAIKNILKIGFTKLKFNKIEAEVFSYNIRSRKHMQNVGFKLEGIQKDKYTLGNKKVSDYLFGITKEEWKKSK